jgi:hypothetical protein
MEIENLRRDNDSVLQKKIINSIIFIWSKILALSLNFVILNIMALP